MEDKHKILLGYGLVIDDEAMNWVRSSSLKLLKSGLPQHLGLFQPPHITIKRPFEAEGLHEIEVHSKLIDQIASQNYTIDVSLSLAKTFGLNVVYAFPNEIDKLNAIHQNTISIVEQHALIKPDSFEGANYIPHATLALGVKQDLTTVTNELISSTAQKEITTRLSKIGLYISMDSINWHLIYSSPLKKSRPTIEDVHDSLDRTHK